MEELNQIYNSNPDTPEISLSQLNIIDFGELLPLLSQFKHLKSLDLSNNGLELLPNDLSCLSSLEFLNINGNMLKETYDTIDHLSTLPQLISLNINLNEEEQVDYIMKKLPDLQELNDLQVERDEEEEEEEEDEDEEDINDVLAHEIQSREEQPVQQYIEPHVEEVQMQPEAKQNDDDTSQRIEEAIEPPSEIESFR